MQKENTHITFSDAQASFERILLLSGWLSFRIIPGNLKYSNLTLEMYPSDCWFQHLNFKILPNLNYHTTSSIKSYFYIGGRFIVTSCCPA